jgi:outer membrane protein TolC
LSVRVLRAFDTVVYRYRKLKILKDSTKYNEDAKDLVERLAKDANKGITGADSIIINTELLKARAQLLPGQAALVAAWQELYRALGMTAGTIELGGGMETPPRVEDDADLLLQTALDRRPDLRARQVAVREADLRVRLEISNRWGNPNIGPAYEYNETRTSFIGLQFSMPLPALNTHRGDIQQRQAERLKAALELTQTEIDVRQDVRAALARLEQARKLVDYYHKEVIPQLELWLKDMQTRFEARQPGADLLKLIDVQRKLLEARDTELDAIFELRQALADLAAAVGDPSVAVLPSPKR